MHDAALEAKNKGIRVSDVFVLPKNGNYAGQSAILKENADTSGGLFITAGSGGTAAAIKEIVKMCGRGPKTTPTITTGGQEEQREQTLPTNNNGTASSSSINETTTSSFIE